MEAPSDPEFSFWRDPMICLNDQSFPCTGGCQWAGTSARVAREAVDPAGFSENLLAWFNLPPLSNTPEFNVLPRQLRAVEKRLA
jgi:hypothetical protein